MSNDCASKAKRHIRSSFRVNIDYSISYSEVLYFLVRERLAPIWVMFLENLIWRKELIVSTLELDGFKLISDQRHVRVKFMNEFMVQSIEAHLNILKVGHRTLFNPSCRFLDSILNFVLINLISEDIFDRKNLLVYPH